MADLPCEVPRFKKLQGDYENAQLEASKQVFANKQLTAQ